GERRDELDLQRARERNVQRDDGHVEQWMRGRIARTVDCGTQHLRSISKAGLSELSTISDIKSGQIFGQGGALDLRERELIERPRERARKSGPIAHSCEA